MKLAPNGLSSDKEMLFIACLSARSSESLPVYVLSYILKHLIHFLVCALVMLPLKWIQSVATADDFQELFFS